MPSADDDDRPVLPHLPMLFRLPRRPATPRRRKMTVVRLGSRRGWRWPGGRRLLAGLLRRVRLRWLAAKYRAALKRLRTFHAALVRDLMDGAASMEAVQSRIMMESYFAAPFLSVATVNCHPHYYARS